MRKHAAGPGPRSTTMNIESTATPPQSVAAAPAILAPDDRHVFAIRARRFQQLAEGHALADWLRYLGRLSLAQQAAMDGLPAITLPDRDALALAHAHRMPPLPAQSWPRDPAWQTALARLCTDLLPHAPAPARADLERLLALPADAQEALATRVLETDLYGADVALLPYVAAALQVIWTAAAARLGGQIEPLDVNSVCPCCGFLPVGSMVKTVAGIGNLRYLHCALCNTEWNLARVRCAACDSDQYIQYRLLDGEGLRHPDAVQAETCDDCKSYLKLFHTEKGAVDPVADDLASLALDILVDEAGYTRAGPNLLMVTGTR